MQAQQPASPPLNPALGLREIIAILCIDKLLRIRIATVRVAFPIAVQGFCGAQSQPHTRPHNVTPRHDDDDDDAGFIKQPERPTVRRRRLAGWLAGWLAEAVSSQATA